LPQAYRSRPRPSSALGAKASTVCSYSLDHWRTHFLLLWSFQGARELSARPTRECRRGRSLKTQQRESIVEVDIALGELGNRTTEVIDEPGSHRSTCSGIPRKEVIQPQLPLRLPCYDFTPIIDPTFDGSLRAVGPPASGIADFRGVTGGVYKARERIHRDVAD